LDGQTNVSLTATVTFDSHYYKILFCEALKKDLGGGHFEKPPRLMPAINRGGHFLLTETVIKTASRNRLTEAVVLFIEAVKNTCLD